MVEISHISYESQTINIDATEKDTIELKPVISILPPAIVLPDSYQIKKIGHFSEKRTTMQGGKNGYTIAEYFSATEFINKMPILTDIILNINPFVINKTFTAIEGEQIFGNCVTHIAKLRVDVRNTSDNGLPGESLIDGGIIYETKDKSNLKTHKTVNIPLENPLVFPEDGLFIVVEWIVTEDIGKHDSVTPGIWCTQSKDGSTSWDKWPAGTSWKQINLGKTEQNSRTFCIGLKILE